MTAQQLIAGMQRLSRDLAESGPLYPSLMDAWATVTPETEAEALSMLRLAQRFADDAETDEELALYDAPAPEPFVYDDPSEGAFQMDDCGLCRSLRMGEAS